MRKKGRIRSWNDQKGFGFIEPDGGGKQIFVHISAFGNRHRKPKSDELVSYSLSTDEHGRPCATKATLPGDTRPGRPKRTGRTLAVMCAISFMCVVGILVVWLELPLVILGFYLAASGITYFMYAVDKSAAKRGAWRTPESTLHWLSLFGGWPGGLVAQQTLRHKSIKPSFRNVFWVTVVLNLAALAWMFTPEGMRTVQSWLGESHSLIAPGKRATIEWADPRSPAQGIDQMALPALPVSLRKARSPPSTLKAPLP